MNKTYQVFYSTFFYFIIINIMDVPPAASTRIEELPDETKVAERILADLSVGAEDLMLETSDSDTAETIVVQDKTSQYLEILKENSDYLVIFAASFGVMSQPFMKLIEKTRIMARFPIHSLGYNSIVSLIMVVIVWALKLAVSKALK